MDGAVYEWNVQECKREGESVLKSCSYTSLAITPDLRTTFAVGSDCTLKEIILAESNVREGGRERERGQKEEGREKERGRKEGRRERGIMSWSITTPSHPTHIHLPLYRFFVR